MTSSSKGTIIMLSSSVNSKSRPGNFKREKANAARMVVNITTPTAEDLQMTNPMAAANDFKANFNMWKSKGQIPGHYAIMLRPKKKSNISQAYLYISNGTNLLHIAHIKMSDGSQFTLTLTGYKTKQNLPASTFTFDKAMVPAGTQVVDLR